MPLYMSLTQTGRARHIEPRRRRGQLAAALASLAALLPLAAQAAGTARAIPCGASEAARQTSLQVRVLGARSDQGRVVVTLWGGDAGRFLKHHGWIARSDAALANHAATVCFALSEPGVYAVSLYHDENGNGHFDRTLLGMPEEGYGVSNDAPTTMGLPSFSSTSMTVGPAGGIATIHLRY